MVGICYSLLEEWNGLKMERAQFRLLVFVPCCCAQAHATLIETECFCVALSGLELARKRRWASNSRRFSSLCFQSTEIKGKYPHYLQHFYI